MSRFEAIHAERVSGTLSMFDRLIFRGHLTRLFGDGALRVFLWEQGVPLADFARWVTATTSGICQNAHDMADQRGMSLIYWAYFPTYLAMLRMGVALMVAGALSPHGTAPLVTGIFITTISLPLLFMFAGIGLRPLLISDGVLRVPTIFGSRTIPLQQSRASDSSTGWCPG